MAKRPRSPNYPALPLGDAIEKLRQYYAAKRTARSSPVEAVETWGYNSLNGASVRVLSTLRQYGLLEDVGGDVKISQRGLTILLEEEGHPEKADAIGEASREPAIFQEILQEFPEELPSDQGLIAWLVRRRGFTEDAARKVNAVLRDTHALMGQFFARQFGSHHGTDDPRPAVDAQPRLESVAAQQAEPTAARRAPVPPATGTMMEYSFPLPDKGVAVLSYAGKPLDDDDLELLGDWFKLTMRALTRAMAQQVAQGNTSTESDVQRSPEAVDA